MNVYKSIIQGLTEAIAYENSEQTAHFTRVTITQPPEISADEIEEHNINSNTH